ncbi:MAG: formimidoylglutamate deiminase [Myxococcales bacterium]|nr:formimidoylglutamate deiminase [Myxococcales bacterium]
MTRYVTVEPDLLYDGIRVLDGGKLTFDESGTLVDPSQILDDVSTTHLRFRNKAIVPGFVNSHSHAFQRLIRGRTHEKAALREDFWSWRQMMMTAVSQLTPEELYQVTYLAFVEMLLAGYTTVGEFHYIHRQPDGSPYDESNYLGKIVIQAALDAGIRIVLLRTATCRSGFANTPAEGGQRRFVEPDPEQIFNDLECLQNYLRRTDDPCSRMGVAPHSIRAVGASELVRFHAWAEKNHISFHIHAAEQPAEVEASLTHTGLRPVEYLANLGVLSKITTLVHATHVNQYEIDRIADTQTTVCVCPTTEADLGDGLLPAGLMAQKRIPMALGSDSQAIIDPFCEMRMLETGERLRTGQRICLGGPSAHDNGTSLTMPEHLMRSGTVAGSRSLHPNVVENPSLLRPGLPADFVVVDLHHPSLVGCSRATLIPSLVLHGAAGAVTDVWVQGKRRVSDKTHRGYNRGVQNFLTVCRRLFETP